MKYLVGTCVKPDCQYQIEQLCPMSDANASNMIAVAHLAAWQAVEQQAQSHVYATSVPGHAVEIHQVIR